MKSVLKIVLHNKNKGQITQVFAGNPISGGEFQCFPDNKFTDLKHKYLNDRKKPGAIKPRVLIKKLSV